jgi:cellulose synthase/poly-beta-1,6-N-acetylglucosamine synthase-like glycosyltransferase
VEPFLNVPLNILLFLTLYFEVFLLTTYFESREQFVRSSALPRMPGKHPSVTIVVPAWNEASTLAGTIDSLLALDYPKHKLHIFIVDDGSTDNTLAVAQQFLTSPQVKVFHKENGGKYTALNLALTHATTDLIGCLDADSFVEREALKAIITYFDDPEVMAVTPSVQIHRPDNVLRRIQSAEYMVGEFTRKIFSRINGLYVIPGPFSIYRRRIFATIGTFVHGYGTEDMEMALRMQSHRMKIENAHNALVYTVSPRTPYALYRQRVRWVSGFLKNAFFKYRYMFLNKKYGNLGLLTMPFAFASIFIALSFSALSIWNLGRFINAKYLEYSALGFPHRLNWFTFDWFSLNLEFHRLAVYLLFFTTVFLLFMGGQMVKNRFHFSRDMLYFILLYGFLAPFWLVRSLYNLITAKEAHWR